MTKKPLHRCVSVGACVLCMFAPATTFRGQSLSDAQLLHPADDSWPTYHGDYSGKRHSSLTQITPRNVHDLTLAWAFQTDQEAVIKSSPLLVNGVLYFTVPDRIWAVDARSGHMLWRYNVPTAKGLHIGQRGVAMYKGWLYFTTPDDHLVSLNANDGTVRWSKYVADVSLGYWMSMAPLIMKNHVIIGVSGDFDNLSGFLRSVDPETGETQWQWDSTRPPGTPNSTTGGMTWMTGTYDPALNLLYWGTGNPTPVLNGIVATRRRSMDVQYRRARCRYRQARMGFSAITARYPRLGRSGNTSVVRRAFSRQTAQVAHADVA